MYFINTELNFNQTSCLWCLRLGHFLCYFLGYLKRTKQNCSETLYHNLLGSLRLITVDTQLELQQHLLQYMLRLVRPLAWVYIHIRCEFMTWFCYRQIDNRILTDFKPIYSWTILSQYLCWDGTKDYYSKNSYSTN
jgi:hypothetical protein